LRAKNLDLTTRATILKQLNRVLTLVIFLQSTGISPLLSTAVQRDAIVRLARLFGGTVADVTHETVILELCAKSAKVDAFLRLLKPYGIVEAARSGGFELEARRGKRKLTIFTIHCFGHVLFARFVTSLDPGIMTMQRSQMDDLFDIEVVEEGPAIDATMLPPG